MKPRQVMPLVSFLCLMIFLGGCTKNAGNDITAPSKTTSWRFAVVGDTHVTSGSDTMLK